MSNRIDDFLAKLTANVPKSKNSFESENNRSLEKIYLNFPGNFGRYQVFPMGTVFNDNYPFVSLPNTREVCIPRKMVEQDGTETQYNYWVKVIPKGAYTMKDMTGRTVSSLTALDEEMLNQVYSLFDQLWDEVNAKESLEIQKNLIRKRNYTLFHAMCLNRWEMNESRTPNRQNFSALFVCTAKDFLGYISNNIKEKSIVNNGSCEWLLDVYNRQTSGRSGYLLFSVNSNMNGRAGYSITATHEVGNEALKNIVIPADDAELMTDPLYTFLGSQAGRDDDNPVGSKRLFNQTLMRETIEYLSEQLTAIRAAKAMGGTDIKDVIKKTSDAALAKQPARQRNQQTTNDPMLSGADNNGSNGFGGQSSVVNPEAVTTKNTNPFESAPVYHADPITGAPVDNNAGGWNKGFGGGGQSAPFNPNPSFGYGDTAKQDDLPF